MIKKLFFTAFVFFITSTAVAFKVSPIELVFSNKGRDSVQTVLVENTTKNKIPVEIFAYDRIHINGKEKRVRTRDFYFFPKQFILRPGEKRNIRLSWMGLRPKAIPKNKKLIMKKGDTNIQSEKAYRLEVRQVPVNLKKDKGEKTGIKFLYNYVASLYVKPSRVKPDFKVLNYKKLAAGKVKFSIQNTGGEHAILSFYNIYAKGKNKTLIVDMKKQKEEIKGINFLPGEKREVILTVPLGIKLGNTAFEFKKRS